MENVVMWSIIAFVIGAAARLIEEACIIFPEYTKNMNERKREQQWLLEAERNEDPDAFYHASRIFTLNAIRNEIIIDAEHWARRVTTLITILGVSLWWWM